MFRMRDERKFLLPLGRRAERPNAKAAKTIDQLMRRLEQEAAPASTRPLSRVRALGSLRLYRNLRDRRFTLDTHPHPA